MLAILLIIFIAFIGSSYTFSYHVNDLNSDRLRLNRYFDLSYAFNNETIYFPGQKQFELHKDKERVAGEAGYS